MRNRKSPLKIEKREAMTRVVALAMLIGMLMSWKTWITTRFFPLTPVSSKLPAFQFPFDYFIFGSLLVLLALIIFLRKPLKAIILFVLLASTLTLWDQTRWQPWFWQYIAMFSVLAYYYWNKADSKRKHYTMYALRIIIASIYVFAGLHKLNPNFITNVGPGFLQILLETFMTIPSAGYVPIGLGLALSEIALGVGLLTRRYCKLATTLGILMHIIILVYFVAFALNSFSAIIPWNIASIIFLILLQRTPPEISLPNFLSMKKFRILAISILIFTLLPVVSLVSDSDYLISWTLFSGNTYSERVFISDETLASMPIEIQRSTRRVNERNVLRMTRVSVNELNVIPYLTPRVFKSLAADLCKYSINKDDIVLEIRGKWLFYKDSALSRFTCEQLEEKPDKTTFVIILDGFSSNYLDRTPFLNQLAEQEFSNKTALTVLPSITPTAHASMFTGVDPKKHGIIDYKTSVLKIPTIITSLKEKDIETCVLVGNITLEFLALETDHSIDTTQLDIPAENSFKIDKSTIEKTLELHKQKICNLFIINLPATDIIGHAFGPSSSEIDNHLIGLDKLLKNFLREVKKSNVIITADHGMCTNANGKGYHGTNESCAMNVPILVKTKTDIKNKLSSIKDVHTIIETLHS